HSSGQFESKKRCVINDYDDDRKCPKKIEPRLALAILKAGIDYGFGPPFARLRRGRQDRLHQIAAATAPPSSPCHDVMMIADVVDFHDQILPGRQSNRPQIAQILSCLRGFLIETRSFPNLLVATLATLPSMSLIPSAPFDLILIISLAENRQ